MTDTRQGGSDVVAGRQTTLEELTDAARAGDAARIVACFADDAELVTAGRAYRGRDAIGAFWAWMCARRQDADYREIGVGVVDCGDVIVREVVESGRANGLAYRVPVMASYRFDSTGKVTRVAVYTDQWAMFQQVAAQSRGLQGVVFRAIVGMLDKASTQGMPTPTASFPD